ncbi:MAG: O-antigen ligase family protein [Coriobacteriia bacterium]|nr:O-antigen ligase family protein [Coriobacteriia bacterium]
MSTSTTSRLSIHQLTWYCFCLIFPASALINGIVPLMGEHGLYAFGGMLSIRAAAFLIPLSLAGACWGYSILRGQTQLRSNPFHWILLILAALIGLATVFAAEQTVAVFGSRTNGQGALIWIAYLLCAFLASQLISSRKRMRQIMWVIIGTGTTVALLALGEVSGIITTGLPQPDWMLARGIATMYTSDHLGTFLVVPAILAIGLALTSKGKEFYMALACTLPLVYSLVFTMTRGAWVGALTGVIVLSILLLVRSDLPSIKDGWKRIAILWVGITVVLLSFLTVFGSTEFTQRFEHAVSDFHTQGQALAGRGTLWSISSELIAGSPLVGLGADNVIYASGQSVNMQSLEREGATLSLGSPHNVYLELALNFGIGFALLMAGLIIGLCIKSLRSLLRKQPKNNELAVWLAALIALAVALITATINVAIMALFFCLLGFLLRTCDHKDQYRKLQKQILAGAIIVLSAGLLICGSIEGASALRGNAHLRSPHATIERSFAALDIAPWRKEPLTHLLQSSGALLMRDELTVEEMYRILNFIIEKDSLSPEPHLAMAQLLIDFEDDYTRAQAHVDRALELRPSSAAAHELQVRIKAVTQAK